MTPSELASKIDHTLLRPDATEEDIKQLCQEAFSYQFYSVCVNPYWVRICKQKLKGSPVGVCSVVGFPLGANISDIKTTEAEFALIDGADEIDMVINVGALKSGRIDIVSEEISRVRDSSRSVLKVIIETACLTKGEIILACNLAKSAGVDFIKTSTGFYKGPCDYDFLTLARDVELIRSTVGPEMGIKASGGINMYQIALVMLDAGATRLGCSASVDIINTYKKAQAYKPKEFHEQSR
ncbi:MAG: deoxyribose-phosphate aldolase [bacterium]|nr:deoxyribose-phosphate aldolase [bacterium]